MDKFRYTMYFFYMSKSWHASTFLYLLFYLIALSEIMLAQQNTSFTPPTTSGFSFVEQNEEEIVMAIVVEAGRLDCVYQTIAAPKYQSFEVVYQVVKGGEHDITFSLKSPAGFMIANDPRKSDGTHRFVLDEPQHGRGDYALCFDNTFSYTNSKKVFFEIYLLDKDGNYLSDNDLKVIQRKDGLLEEHFEVFNMVTTKVKGNLNEIERAQAQFRAIEARDRFIIETAFERINLWSFVHLFCLLFAAGIQVFMLRSLFVDDSLVGRFVGKFN